MDVEPVLWALACAGVIHVILRAFFWKPSGVPAGLKHFSELPCPPGLPLLGNLLEVAKKGYHICHLEWLRTYGTMFRYRMGTRDVVMACDPALVRDFCVQRFKVFHDRPMPPSATPLSTRGLLFAKGDYWAGLRAALTPIFHQERHLFHRYSYMAHAARDFMRTIESRTASPTAMQPQEATGSLFGTPMVYQDSEATSAAAQQHPQGSPGAPLVRRGASLPRPDAVDVLPLLEHATLDAIGMTCFGRSDWFSPAALGESLEQEGARPVYHIHDSPIPPDFTDRARPVPPPYEGAGRSAAEPSAPTPAVPLRRSASALRYALGSLHVAAVNIRRLLGLTGTPSAYRLMRPSERYAEIEKLGSNLGAAPQLLLLLTPELLLPLVRAVLCLLPGLNLGRVQALRSSLLRDWEDKLRARHAAGTPDVLQLDTADVTAGDISVSNAPTEIQGQDLVCALGNARVKGNGKKLTLGEQTVALFNIIGAGSTTTASVIASVLYFLAKFPGKQAIVQAEIDGVIKSESFDKEGRGKGATLVRTELSGPGQGRPEQSPSGDGQPGEGQPGEGQPGEGECGEGQPRKASKSVGKSGLVVPRPETLLRLQYLDWVVKESLRLCPPGAMVAREAVEDTQLGGYFLPKGTRVIAPVYALHLYEPYFPRPREFLPERFREQEMGVQQEREGKGLRRQGAPTAEHSMKGSKGRGKQPGKEEGGRGEQDNQGEGERPEQEAEDEGERGGQQTEGEGEFKNHPMGPLWTELSSGAYLPFGAGPRMCLGKRYGIVEAKLFLFLVLQKYSVAPGVDSKELELSAGLTLKAKDGVWLVLTDRTGTRSGA